MIARPLSVAMYLQFLLLSQLSPWPSTLARRINSAVYDVRDGNATGPLAIAAQGSALTQQQSQVVASPPDVKASKLSRGIAAALMALPPLAMYMDMAEVISLVHHVRTLTAPFVPSWAATAIAIYIPLSTVVLGLGTFSQMGGLSALKGLRTANPEVACERAAKLAASVYMQARHSCGASNFTCLKDWSLQGAGRPPSQGTSPSEELVNEYAIFGEAGDIYEQLLSVTKVVDKVNEGHWQLPPEWLINSKGNRLALALVRRARLTLGGFSGLADENFFRQQRLQMYYSSFSHEVSLKSGYIARHLKALGFALVASFTPVIPTILVIGQILVKYILAPLHDGLSRKVQSLIGKSSATEADAAAAADDDDHADAVPVSDEDASKEGVLSVKERDEVRKAWKAVEATLQGSTSMGLDAEASVLVGIHRASLKCTEPTEDRMGFTTQQLEAFDRLKKHEAEEQYKALRAAAGVDADVEAGDDPVALTKEFLSTVLANSPNIALSSGDLEVEAAEARAAVAHAKGGAEKVQEAAS